MQNKFLYGIWAALLLCLVPNRALSESTIDFEVDGIAYHITSAEERTVSVTKDFAQPYVHQSWDEEGNYPRYTGDIVVPATVSYNGVEYTVTSVGEAFRASLRLRSIRLPETITRIEQYAFEDCLDLKEVVMPDALSYIAKYAFYGCGLREFTVPKGVTTIAEYAFEDCWMDSVSIIYNTLKDIRGYAFPKAKSLYLDCTEVGYEWFLACGFENVYFGKNVRKIRNDAFGYCDNIKQISIPETITEMGSNVFRDCKNLKSIHLPGSLGTINANILGYSYIETVTLGEGITSIGVSSFKNIPNLRKIRFPQSLRSIDGYAFEGCSQLSSVTLPPKCSYLGFNSFAGCSSLAYVFVQNDSIAFPIPSNAFDETVYENATLYVKEGMKELFAETDGWGLFQTIIDEEEPAEEVVTSFEANNIYYHITQHKARIVEVVSGEKPYQGNITIPAKVKYDGKEYTVKTIGDYAFCIGDSQWNAKENTLLTTVWIEDGVESIGECAFYRCTSLKSLRLSLTLNHIGSHAFSDCSALTSLQLPQNITHIEQSTYSGLRSLTSLTIPEGVEYIGEYAFTGLGVHDLVIPKSVKRIGRSAFYGSSMKTLNILGSPHIEEIAFDGCGQLQSVSFHAGLKSLHSQAFRCCNSLKSISLPEGLKRLEDNVFSGCTSLREVHLPASLEHLSPSAFSKIIEPDIAIWYGCDSIEVIRVAPGGVYYDSRQDCNAVIDKRTNTLVLGCRNTVIPSDVTAIGDDAFRERIGLKNICIPEGVTSIGHYAFSGCKDLESADLPQSLTSIGWCAFENCAALKHINIPESVTNMGYWAFWGCNSLESVEVKAAQTYALDVQAFLSGICDPAGGTDAVQATLQNASEMSIYSLDGRLLKVVPVGDAQRMKEGLKPNEIYIIKMGQIIQKIRF